MAETRIDTLSVEIDYSAGTANTGLQQLTSTLEKLSGITAPAISNLKSVSTQLNSFVKSTQNLSSVNLKDFSSAITSLSSAVKPLSELGKSNLGSFITQLKKIPDLNKSLDANTIAQFTAKVNQLSTALVPLANNLSKVGSVLNNLPSKLNKVSNYAQKTNTTMSSLSNISKLLNFGTAFAIGRQLGNTVSGFIKKSNEYVEDLNLFNVAMGQSTEKAKQFIDTTSEALGLDPAPMMRYMGVFQMIATGFGIGADNAYKMSKNLTQLTYDISSFYNLDIDEAAQKVQSAIAGKIICLIYKGLYIITYLIAGTPKRIMA